MDFSLFSMAGDESTLETGDPTGKNILDKMVGSKPKIIVKANLVKQPNSCSNLHMLKP
jgi:hypothetical protein